MAHHIYHTEALVLEGRGIGEANKYFAIFTRELGMIEASAQGVRKVESKLRSSLRDFSRVYISLVRGKNGWKITNAIGESNLYDQLKTNQQALLVVGHSCALLKRLMHGEEKNERLFALVTDCFAFLATHGAELTKEDIANTECMLVLNVLHLLGYVGERDDLKNLTSPIWSKQSLSLVNPLRQKALAEINRSLKESQL